MYCNNTFNQFKLSKMFGSRANNKQKKQEFSTKSYCKKIKPKRVSPCMITEKRFIKYVDIRNNLRNETIIHIEIR